MNLIKLTPLEENSGGVSAYYIWRISTSQNGYSPAIIGKLWRDSFVTDNKWEYQGWGWTSVTLEEMKEIVTKLEEMNNAGKESSV